MKPFPSSIIKLQPVRHAAPAWPDFEDLPSVLAFERAMRIHRAHVDPFEVAPLDGRVDGVWRVSSGNGKGGSYLVDIVDGSGVHDACTCPDFLVGELGVCKHLEAVRRAIQTRPVLRRSFQRLGLEPIGPTLTVDACGGITFRKVGPWVLPAKGRLKGSGNGGMPIEGYLLERGRAESMGIRVVHAVPPAAALLEARARNGERRSRILQAHRDGKVGVDVLRKPLFPYQEEGVIHLVANGRGILADDMGLGKTVQAIAACEILRARGEAETVVVVTPASLKHQWAHEIEKYSGQRAVVLGGPSHARAAALASSAPYKILSYELTWRELHRLRDLEADILILDEAQRARNFRTRTAATLRSIPSRHLFVLTGTPIENRLDDLYSLCQLLDPGILGPLWRFNLEFHQQGSKGKVRGAKNMSRLRETIAPVLLRRRKETVLDQLPELTEQTRYTPLTQDQEDYEAECRAEAARLLAIADKRPLTPREEKLLQAALLKARQACDAMELAVPKCPKPASPKLDEFEAYVAEIAAQGTHKILVFSEWVEMLKLAASRLDKLGIRWTMLTGSVPTEKRPALLDGFRTDPTLQVLLSSDAGGVGLNLQVASYVVHLDLPWNPARLDQRTSRAHRLGQTRGVSVTYFCSEKGIERGIEGTLAGKRGLRSAALDADSQVEDLEVQGFSVFLRQLQDVLERMEDAGPEPDSTTLLEEGAASEPVEIVAEIVEAGPRSVPEPTRPEAGSSMTPAGTTRRNRSQDRLRLAEVVLEAGFAGDAVKAVYEGLAAAIGDLLDPPGLRNHEELVGAIYRDLVPSGRIPLAAPGVLARIHDLASLERMGIDVDPGLARGALDEARDWIGRLDQARPQVCGSQEEPRVHALHLQSPVMP